MPPRFLAYVIGWTTDVTHEDRELWRRGITERNAPYVPRPSVVGWRRLAVSRKAPKTDKGGREVYPYVTS